MLKMDKSEHQPTPSYLRERAAFYRSVPGKSLIKLKLPSIATLRMYLIARRMCLKATKLQASGECHPNTSSTLNDVADHLCDAITVLGFF